MPNWVKNEIRAPKHVIDTLITINDKGKSRVDFNTVVPTPDDVFKGSLGEEEIIKYPGQKNWHGFGLANWGTKWNASATSRPNNTSVTFETAWSHPFPIIKKLSEMFPTESVIVGYADEDTGSNLGVYKIINGQTVRHARIDEHTAVAQEFASLFYTGHSYREPIVSEIEDTELFLARCNGKEPTHGYFTIADMKNKIEYHRKRLQKFDNGLNEFKAENPGIDLSDIEQILEID